MKNKLLTDIEINGLLEDLPSKESDDTNINPKDAFVDTVNPYQYIELDSNALAFDRVNRVLNRNLKMTLIYGSPGTGKSMFLSKLHNNLLEQSKCSILVSSPILEDSQLFQTISFEIFKDSSLGKIPKNFNNLIETINSENEYISRVRPILLLDEAQLYTNATLEKIRILADTQTVRVIFAVHQLKEENIFAQEHFKSRIWEKIELKNASLNELKIYIQKKLMGISMLPIAKQFTKLIVRNIYKITKGNYRVTNNLLYSYFNNYPQLYKSQFQKQKLKIRSKEIEITAIQIGFLNPNISKDIDIQHLPTAEIEWKNWKKKIYIKYIFIFLIPAILYILLKIYLYEDNNVTSHKDLDVREFPKEEIVEENNSKKNITFETPEYKEIVEDEVTENDEDYIDSEEIEEIEADPQFLNELEFEKNRIVEENISKPELEIEEDTKFKSLSSFRKEVEKNIPLSDIDLSPVLFKSPIEIYPDLSFLDNFQEYNYSKTVIEGDYILSLKSDFIKNKTIHTVIKILEYYKIMMNNEEIYKYSLELNRLDPNLKEPYINIERILLKKEILEEVKKVRDSCKNCEF